MIIRSIILTACLLKAATLPAEAMDPSKLSPLITQQEISQKIKEVSHRIKDDYEGKDLVIIMVLKGALCLVADMIREIDLPLDIETVRCSSYGARGTMRGELMVHGIDHIDIEGRDVLLVDDIFDSGNTMITLLNALKDLKPKSLKSCVLLYKHDVEKVTDYVPEYVLFEIQNQFVVGYGLDYKERYRGLTGVYVLDPS